MSIKKKILFQQLKKRSGKDPGRNQKRKSSHSHYRNFLMSLTLFLFLFLVMALGYGFFEGHTLYDIWIVFVSHIADSWLAETTLPTFSRTGSLFSSLIALASMVVGGYFISVLTSFIVDGQLRDYLKISNMDKQIAKLKDHYIICGGDDTTREIIRELQAMNQPLVVVYNNEEALEEVQDDTVGEFLYLDDDPTEDETLVQAGIERAKGFVASLDSDPENHYLVFSARGLNPDMKIVAKVFDDLANLEKMKKAGADEVVSPFHIGGLRISSLLTRPAVVTFLDKMIKQTGDYRFGEVEIAKGSALVGKKLSDTNVLKKAGVNPIAVRSAGTEEFSYNLPPDYRFQIGDTIIAIGTPAQMSKLKDI